MKPPKPNPPEEETDEEKGLRRLFEQVAGSVRKQKSCSLLSKTGCLHYKYCGVFEPCFSKLLKRNTTTIVI